MYIVNGCSWGCGEWDGSTERGLILHGGLAQYLYEDGHNVVNLSQAASSNRESVLRLNNFLFNNHHLKSRQDITVVIFQTEWTRDFPYQDPDDENYWDQPEVVADRIVSRFYYDLSDLAQRYNIKIKVVGGAGDTIMLDDFSKIYTGVEIICQSMTNLLINDIDIVSTPVLSEWSYERYGQKFLELFKKHCTDIEQMNTLLDTVSRGEQRYALWQEHKTWFWPDGRHPNRVGHEKLYRFLKQSNRL